MSLLKEKIELSIQEAELATQQGLSSMPGILRWLLILCLLAIIPSYFIAKTISYKIWSYEYSKKIPVAKPSFTDPKEPKISEVSVTTLGEGVYSAAVNVSNQNLDLSANNIPYTFNFYNSQTEKVYSENGRMFLLPNQTKYVLVPRFTTAEKISFTEFSINPEQIKWQKRLSIPTVKLDTSAPSTFQQGLPPAFVVEGSFTNQSPYTLKQVKLIFVLFDQSLKIIGTSQREEFTVAPFERRTYKQLWPGLVAPNLSTVKIFADTNTLDGSNLIIENPSSDSSSNLSRPKNLNPF